MKKLLLTLLAASAMAMAGALEPIKLNQPDLDRGKSLMQSLSQRQTVRDFADKEIGLQDLSDLLWAANGVNRPDGKRTAPSAMNKQDIMLYVARPEGVYYYNHKDHALEPVSEGDHRQKVRGNTPAMNIIIVAEDGQAKFAGVDAGYVSQNIYLACTALDMATVACGGFDEDSLTKACKLTGKNKVVLHHPVGYPKK